LDCAGPAEIARGDRFFSPFLAVGWSEREEMNIRPAQTLGLLKVLFAAGAEFIHWGFFSDVGRGQNWVWQTSMPAYAQGVVMAVDDLFRNSELLEGDFPLPVLGCYTVESPARDNATLLAQCSRVHDTNKCGRQGVIGEGAACEVQKGGDGWHGSVSYRFWAQSQSVAVFVRKHVRKETYLITCTVQAQSNMVGNAPLVLNTSIELGGSRVHFECRRQGSVYVYNRASAQNGTFTQLDRWHSHKHPSHWTGTIALEAEVHAALSEDSDTGRHTRTERRSGDDAVRAYDYVGATTFVILAVGSPSLTYPFTPGSTAGRPHVQAAFALWVRLRGGGQGVCLRFSIDESSVGHVQCRESVLFRWEEVARFNVSTSETHSLRMEFVGSEDAVVPVDALHLVPY
jgi:hypothetical protein